jgi:hypothetical protein
MYTIKVVAVNETIEVEVKAKYCLVDAGNNLVFINKLDGLAEPIAMFPAGRWVSVVKG